MIYHDFDIFRKSTCISLVNSMRFANHYLDFLSNLNQMICKDYYTHEHPNFACITSRIDIYILCKAFLHNLNFFQLEYRTLIQDKVLYLPLAMLNFQNHFFLFTSIIQQYRILRVYDPRYHIFCRLFIHSYK